MIALLSTVALHLGCAADESTPVLSILYTAPMEAGDHPASSPLQVAFDGYLDPSTSWSRLATLKSGEVNIEIHVGYDPVGRALVITAVSPLRPGVGYLLTIARDEVRGYDGAELDEDFELSFVTTPTMEATPVRDEVIDFTAQISPIVENQCGCHGPPRFDFPELTPQTLIGMQSQRQPQRVLVVPGQPLQSYLIQRILTDYPGVRGLPKELDDAEKRLFITWVNQLAR